MNEIDKINKERLDKINNRITVLEGKASFRKGTSQAHQFIGEGYQQSDLIISSGFDALTKYEKFLRKKREKIKEKIKNDLLVYNKDDLKRTKFIYDFLKTKS